MIEKREPVVVPMGRKVKPIEPQYEPDAEGYIETSELTDVEVPEDDANSVELLEDGGALVNFGSEPALDGELDGEQGHLENLAVKMGESDLTSLATDLIESYEADRRSRKDWEEAYKAGLPLLGFKVEERTRPWVGAAGVYHPVLSEAVIRSLASIMTESFPAKGPVKTIVVGKWTREKEKKAARVSEELNYQLTQKMKEYRPEFERNAMNMIVSGSGFKKVYYDPILKRPTSCAVAPEHFVISYGSTSLETCERYTHELHYTDAHVNNLQAIGYYRDVKLTESSGILSTTVVDDQKEKISGTSASVEVDTRREILEMYVDLDIESEEGETNLPLPYIVTIDKQNNTILSIYRNWDEKDADKKKIVNFVHYQYLPGFGFYGLGLIHILGGLATGATSILRQLVDAGTLSNLRAGYKTKGLRIKGDNKPLEPGELRDVDVLSGAIRDNMYFPDFRGPSPELGQLLANLVDEARRIGSVSDMKASDISGDMPVGTILAIFERNMKVQSAVQARFHASLKEEFKLLSKLISQYSARYDYEIDGDPAILVEDFNPDIVDVIPVSDPNAMTMSQRLMINQAVMEMANSKPDIYDIPELHRRALDIMGMKEPEKIIPDKNQMQPMDPISENMAILGMQPVKAFLEQDHESHIKAHMAAADDPSIIELMQRSPSAQAVASAMAAHIQEHVAFAYRRKMEKAIGTQLPPPGTPMPPDIEAAYSKAVADAADIVLSQSKNELASRKAKEVAQDPLVQMQLKELENKSLDTRRKIAKDQADSEFRNKQLGIKSLLELARQASTERSFKAEQMKDSIQKRAENALKGQELALKRAAQQSTIGSKVLDRLMQEAGKAAASRRNPPQR